MAKLVGSILIATLIVGQIAWLALRDMRETAAKPPVVHAHVPASQDDFRCAEDVAKPRALAPVPDPRALAPVPEPTALAPVPDPPALASVSEPTEQSTTQQIPIDLASLIQETVVQVALPNSDATGTGFIARVREDGFDVVTAAHVLNGDRLSSVGQTIEVTSFFNAAVAPLAEGTSIESTSSLKPSVAGRVHRMVWLAAQDKINDVALLRIVSKELPGKRLTLASEVTSSKNAEPFEAWQIRWTPQETPVLGTASVLREQVAAREPRSPKIKYWICSPASVPGMSGGPLLNSDGNVLGIASGNSSGEAYYIPVEAIAKLLER